MGHPETVLIGTADPLERRLLEALLADRCPTRTAEDGRQLREAIRHQLPALVILDSRLTPAGAVDLCRALKIEGSPGPPILALCPAGHGDLHEALLEAGADGVALRPSLPAALLREVEALLARERSRQEASNLEKLLFSVVSAFDSRDESKVGHPERVARMSRRLGERLGLPEEDLLALHKGGILHDIGMLKVPRHIVEKQGPLSPAEFETMKLHTIWGERMCRPVASLERVLPIIRHHHEQIDGGGYPDGLRGEQIPLTARVLAVAEFCDALSSDRPYRPRMSRPDTTRYLREYSRRGWLDPGCVEAFLDILEEEGWPEVPVIEHPTFQLRAEASAPRPADEPLPGAAARRRPDPPDGGSFGDPLPPSA